MIAAAETVLDHARGRLSGLNADEWQAIEELGQRIADAIAIERLDQAERDARLAAVLAAISELPKSG
jgi:hypothetical protein